MRAVEVPRRADTQVITHVAAMLAYCKRLEDSLGPCEIVDTVMAQHRLAHRLIASDCPEQLRRPLNLVDTKLPALLAATWWIWDNPRSDTCRPVRARAESSGGCLRGSRYVQPR